MPIINFHAGSYIPSIEDHPAAQKNSTAINLSSSNAGQRLEFICRVCRHAQLENVQI